MDAQRIAELERENRELRRGERAMAESTGGRTGPVTIRVLRHRSSVMAGILTHDQKQLAFRLRARGWRLVDIAREVGCPTPMVGLMVSCRPVPDRCGRSVGASVRLPEHC